MGSSRRALSSMLRCVWWRERPYNVESKQERRHKTGRQPGGFRFGLAWFSRWRGRSWALPNRALSESTRGVRSFAWRLIHSSACCRRDSRKRETSMHVSRRCLCPEADSIAHPGDSRSRSWVVRQVRCTSSAFLSSALTHSSRSTRLTDGGRSSKAAGGTRVCESAPVRSPLGAAYALAAH